MRGKEINDELINDIYIVTVVEKQRQMMTSTGQRSTYKQWIKLRGTNWMMTLHGCKFNDIKGWKVKGWCIKNKQEALRIRVKKTSF